MEIPIEDFRTARSQTLALAGSLSQKEFDWIPGPHQWSIGQVLDHLFLVEQMVRGEIALLIRLFREGKTPEIVRTFSDLNTGPAYLPRALLPLFSVPFSLLTRLMPRRLFDVIVRFPQIPFQAADRTTPAHGKNAAELRESLAQSINQTGCLLAANRDCEWDRLVLTHPALGVNSVPQLIGVLASHERRHHGQIQRARRLLENRRKES